MYFRKLALLLALATATATTADAREHSARRLKGEAATVTAAADARKLKNRAKSPKGDDDYDGPTCAGANNILGISEIIGEFSYSGLVVESDNDDDPESDAIVGHLSMTASSGAIASIELLESSVVVSSGDLKLVLDPTVPDIKLNGESISFSAVNAILEFAQQGFVDGSLKDVAEGYLGMINWINAHSTDIPNEDEVSILSCNFWTNIKRFGLVTSTCVGSAAGWVACVGLPEPLSCVAAGGASIACVEAFESYLECL